MRVFLALDDRNHPLLIHCKRGKVFTISLFFISILNFESPIIVFLQWTAPHWLSCGMHKKIAEMVSIICFWWVSKVCRCQGQSVGPEVHRIVWSFIFEAPPTLIFKLKEIEIEITWYFKKLLLPPMEYFRDEVKYNELMPSLILYFFNSKSELDEYDF